MTKNISIELRYDPESLGDIDADDYELAVMTRMQKEWPGCDVSIDTATEPTRVWVEGEPSENGGMASRALELQQEVWEELCRTLPL